MEFAEEIAQSIDLYPGVENFLKKVKTLADVVIISSGIKAILDSIFAQKGLSEIPRIAGTHLQNDDFLIGREEKGLICQFFKSQGDTIIAFGDSDVDTLMLQKADHAVVVVNHRNNEDLMPNLESHPAVSQISFKEFTHPGIPVTSFNGFLDTYQNLFSNSN
jgi:phosphoserine phosphatase